MVSKTDLLQKTSEYMDYISEHKKNIQKARDLAAPEAGYSRRDELAHQEP